MIDIIDTELKIITSILKKWVSDREVWVFGSRVNGNAKSYSDIDLVIKGSSPLSLQELANLKNDFQSSDLSIRVDIVDWNSIEENFKKIIQKKYEILKF